jgi:hypothetical protein
MKIKLSLFLFVFFSSQSVFSAECDRPIDRIFTGYTPSTSKIHIEHGDGFSASVVRLPYINNDEKIVDRILSVLLAAKMGEKDVRFRYLKGEDNSAASCTPEVSQILQAVWLK